MEKITKAFSGLKANREVDLEVREGEIHALLGENGAGKTVLMSILFGLHQADSGRIRLRGVPTVIRSPRYAIALGIGMVHQHFMLVPTLTMWENVALGQHRPWKLLGGRDRIVEGIRDLGLECGIPVDPNALVDHLSVAEQQCVEILKNLIRGVKLLILDKPTAVLTPQESARLLELLRDLAKRGLTVIFITHKLKEVTQLSDRVTILRRERTVATFKTTDSSPRELARIMVGRDLVAKKTTSRNPPGDTVLKVKGLEVTDERGTPALRGVSFRVRRGEIVGIAGVAGNGQWEIAHTLAGFIRPSSGEFRIKGTIAHELAPSALYQLGLAHVPEDRHQMGAVLPLTIAENLVLQSYRDPAFSRLGFFRKGAITSHCRAVAERFPIGPADIDGRMAHLSGGNQQKVVVARELLRDPVLLLLNQPTRGIDIGTTQFVHRRILAEREAGKAILLISSELDELFSLADRILVIYEGRIVGEVPPDSDLLEEIGLMMAGRGVN